MNSVAFSFMRWRFGLVGHDAATERALEDKLTRTIDGADMLDGVALLAFDAVYDPDGNVDWNNTHFFVTNDYVIELCKRHPRMLFAASVHPYRKDAVAELERCIAAGAVMVKWLPITQGFNPADPGCIPFYEALAHHHVPLLSHTGWEHCLPNIDRTVADPMLLLEPLRRGVTVIAAHCGSRVFPWEIDYVGNWARLAKEYEHFYGDTSALNSPGRAYAFDIVLNDPVLRSKLVHGSDWPILAFPPPMKLGLQSTISLLGEDNWMRRDILIKRRLGLDQADPYWHRASTLMRLPVQALPDLPAEKVTLPI